MLADIEHEPIAVVRVSDVSPPACDCPMTHLICRRPFCPRRACALKAANNNAGLNRLLPTSP